MEWQFEPRDPVLRHAVQGPGLYPDNNDVTAWQEGAWSYALTGSRDTPGSGDTQHLFRSRDLAAWEYVDRFYISERKWTGAKDDCSCPDFFRIGSQWMLLHFCHHFPSGSRYYLARCSTTGAAGSSWPISTKAAAWRPVRPPAGTGS